MKRFLSIMLALLMLLSLVPAAYADSDILTVQTRTASYTFKVGDTFTYSYWLRLTPDLVNYSEDYLINYITGIAGDNGIKLPGTSLGKLQLGTLTKMKLKSAGGNIMYDTDCLALVSASMPNTKKGYTVQKNDALAGSLVDSGVLDFTNSDLGFWTGKVNNAADQKVFQNTNVLVTCKFKVTRGSDTPVYLRTRLRHLEVTTNGLLGLTQGTDIIIVHRDQSVFIPYESYETINDEKPTVVLKSLVDDVGLDIRYFNTAGDKDDYKRPGAGVAVNMYGFTTDGRYKKLSTTTSGEKVTWFYDVPYGQYYVNCSFTNANGNYYATPDPEKAEHINVPATGEVQALWLVRTDPATQKRIDVSIEWQGDNGYLPVRPDYLVADLKSSDNSSVLHKRLIERDQTSESFDCVNIYDANGDRITYDLNISAVYGASQVASGSSVFPYTVTVDKTIGADGAEDFAVTLVYCGDKSDIGGTEPDENEHYWSEKTALRVEPSCTTDGRAYYVCSTCHQTKYETLPATGHTWDPGSVVKAATETTEGQMLYKCTVCGATKTESIPKTEHRHNYVNGVCTGCGAAEPGYKPPVTQSFIDVPSTAYYYDAVQWAVANGVTNGTSATTFSPNEGCTRAQVVTFLYRAAGEPSVSSPAGFADVHPGAYYYKAVQWAVANGITKGTSATTFSPDDTCTRGQIVTFLYRAAGSPAVSGLNPFIDVPSAAFYRDAVQWASSNGITTGTSPYTFTPNATCTRAEVVTFLYRAQK